MRSDSLIPLYQFIQWWGVDPYIAAGIDYNLSAPKTVSSKRGSSSCTCLLQHEWQSPNNWSRDALIRMLKNAEDFFISEGFLYPVPTQILNEQHETPDFRKINGVQLHSDLPSYPLYYPCNVQNFGIIELSLIDIDVQLTKDSVGDGSGELLDIFTCSFEVPPDTESSAIRVFFHEDDQVDTECETDLTWEIRPLSYQIDETTSPNWTVMVNAPAFLFKQPSLDESDACVPHSLETYVERVSVYIEVVNPCLHGQYVCPNVPCSEPPCTETEMPICLTKRLVGNQIWVVPHLATCDEENVYQSFGIDL